MARDAWVEKDYPLVLWLVPSNTIRATDGRGTAQYAPPVPAGARRGIRRPAFAFSISTDFTTIRPQDIRDNACVVVGTIQTLRVNNTDGRKVYAHNENMEPHFSVVPKALPGLEQRDGSTAR